MSLLTGCSKLLTTSLAHLSSLAPVSLCPEHLKTNAKMPPLPTSSATRKKTKGAAEAQALLLDLTLFFLQACLCSSLPWALGSLLIFCFYCQFIFYSLFCRTKMDAKKPRKCSLTSFPNLKTRKKENLGFVKVRILEFNWGKRMASSWRLGDPGPIGDCCVPSTFDNKMRGRKVWEDQASLQSQDWAGLGAGTGRRAGVQFYELQDCKALIEQVTCICGGPGLVSFILLYISGTIMEVSWNGSEQACKNISRKDLLFSH